MRQAAAALAWQRSQQVLLVVGVLLASCLQSGCFGMIRAILYPTETAIAAGSAAAGSVTSSILDDPDLVGALESQAVRDLDRIASDSPSASNADTINDANQFLSDHVAVPRDKNSQGYGGAKPLKKTGAYEEAFWDHQTDLQSIRRGNDRLEQAQAGHRIKSHMKRQQSRVLWHPGNDSAFDQEFDATIEAELQQGRPITREQSLYHLQAGRN